MFGSDMPKWANAVVGGFELNTSLNWSGGLPFTPSYGECSSDIAGSNANCMPDKIGPRMPLNLTSLDPINHSRSYFIPGPTLVSNGSVSGVFQRPQVDQFGTVGRNNYFGPSLFNTDLSLLKNIPIREIVTLQLRLNAFNVFNHINAGNPASTCIDCTVGSNAGVIKGMALGANPRQLEFSGRITF